ncbi:hypothetical protein NM208_g4517 [Fusarium decemcellulare]|uniref:Uncharacterized protein n=1 Tax=Fusarium decemcellulare TaxID=57161 RepID=A0ACC1SKE5_9HYPO|nr:hypothetical protein NM208_g4517 [Fusarium decemcellulare]
MPANHEASYTTLLSSDEPVPSPGESQLWHLLESLADPRSLEPLPRGIATFRLFEKRYDLLLKVLKERPTLWGFVDDKVRYDYDPSKECLMNGSRTNFARLLNWEPMSLNCCQGGKRALISNFPRRKLVGPTGCMFNHDEAGARWLDGKNLKRLAGDYILRSNGDIRAVIGIDPFRSSDGSPANPRSSLKLILHDFALDELSSNVDVVVLAIPYE